jgi:hypothetical protein
MLRTLFPKWKTHSLSFSSCPQFRWRKKKIAKYLKVWFSSDRLLPSWYFRPSNKQEFYQNATMITWVYSFLPRQLLTTEQTRFPSLNPASFEPNIIKSSFLILIHEWSRQSSRERLLRLFLVNHFIRRLISCSLHHSVFFWKRREVKVSNHNYGILIALIIPNPAQNCSNLMQSNHRLSHCMMQVNIYNQ